MVTLQTGTIEKPLDKPELARQAISALDRAWAMGLLSSERIDPLSLVSLTQAFKTIQKAGIGKQFIAELSTTKENRTDILLKALRGINQALEDSPVPQSEWGRLDEVLGPELLANLVGVTKVSLGRYKKAERTTPNDTARRLHLVAMLVADLAGSYNLFGIVSWFARKRSQLKDRSPLQILQGRPWDPDSPEVLEVKRLAEALAGSPAT